ncbi:uncharacterized protein [Anabrus simplex]|uniref:uncharacterized protein n=1 Tax=Anabrus simplex TaxID=316456 RepID=UPI0034DD5674
MMSARVTSLAAVLLLGVALGLPRCPDGDSDDEPCKEKRSYPIPYDTHLRLTYRPGDIVEGRYEPYRYYWPQNYNRYYDDWRRTDWWYVPTNNPRVRLGTGRFRLVGRHDAELLCDFPYPQDVISNIVWTRADRPEYATRALYQRQNGVTQRRGGSTMYLRDVRPGDTGLYRCLATSRDPVTSALRTVFQDVHFYPAV